jgi:hypothetical protein
LTGIEASAASSPARCCWRPPAGPPSSGSPAW